jgi:hypothetical protein
MSSRVCIAGGSRLITYEVPPPTRCGFLPVGRSREVYEVIIPRKIAASEAHRVRHLLQVIGWRYLLQPLSSRGQARWQIAIRDTLA